MDGIPYPETDDFTYVSLDEFDTLVLPHVPGIQRPLYELERITVIREFCRRTDALMGLHPSIFARKDRTQYTLDRLPEDLTPLTMRRLLQANGNKVKQSAFLLNTARTAFSLKEQYAGSLDGERVAPLLSLQLCRSTSRIEAEFFNRWDEGIAAGIIERLVLSPKKAWTNVQAAPLFNARYHDAIAEAKIAVSRNFGIHAQRTIIGGFE